MRIIVQIVSLLSLAATVAAPGMFLAGTIELDSMKTALFTATIVWFIATPWWMD